MRILHGLGLLRWGQLRGALLRGGQLRGSEAHARYYTASVACALEHLHARFVVYRVLKTDNLLLGRHGRLKLTDMGLAKFVVGKTYTACGTSPYLAPEVLRRRGYTLDMECPSCGQWRPLEHSESVRIQHPVGGKVENAVW